MTVLTHIGVVVVLALSAVWLGPAKPADEIQVTPAAQGMLTDKDAFDKVRQGSFCRVHKLKMTPAPGTVYQIDLESGDFDAYLRVEDSKGTNLAEDDDGGEGLNARLFFVPAKADTYRIIVTTFNNKETGAYALTVRPIKPALAAAGQLGEKDPFDKERKKCHHKVHEVKMAKGHRYTIDLRSGQFDPWLRLEDADGKIQAENDDGGGGRNARLRFTPERDGTYRIVVTSFGENETGDYSLIVRE
jgi:hypothetical protein